MNTKQITLSLPFVVSRPGIITSHKCVLTKEFIKLTDLVDQVGWEEVEKLPQVKEILRAVQALLPILAQPKPKLTNIKIDDPVEFVKELVEAESEGEGPKWREVQI